MPDEPLTQEQVNAILRNLANNQKEVMTDIGSIFDTLSKIDPEQYSSAALKIIGYAFQLVALFSPDPESEMKASIARIAQALHDAFELLQAQNAAIEANARATFLNDALRSTVDALSDLQVALGDPSFFDAGELILKCQSATSLFLHEQVSPIKDSIWNITRSSADVQKIYWSDSQRTSVCYWSDMYHGGYRPDIARSCYGPQCPPFNDDHATVFEYRLALPTFLWSVTALLLVGRTLREDFAAKMDAYLGDIQARLEWVHAKIRDEGLTALSPPDWNAIGLEQAACPRTVGGFVDPRPAIGLEHIFVAGVPYAARAVIEYGAVEKFSGNNSVFECTVDADHADDAAFAKIRLRVLEHLKRVYASCGLPEVQATIRGLRRLRGQAVDDAPSFAEWSLAEVFRVPGLPAAHPARSLRTLAQWIVRTQPLDTPYDPSGPNPQLSLRRLLTDGSR